MIDFNKPIKIDDKSEPELSLKNKVIILITACVAVIVIQLFVMFAVVIGLQTVDEMYSDAFSRLRLYCETSGDFEGCSIL